MYTFFALHRAIPLHTGSSESYRDRGQCMYTNAAATAANRCIMTCHNASRPLSNLNSFPWLPSPRPRPLPRPRRSKKTRATKVASFPYCGYIFPTVPTFMPVVIVAVVVMPGVRPLVIVIVDMFQRQIAHRRECS